MLCEENTIDPANYGVLHMPPPIKRSGTRSPRRFKLSSSAAKVRREIEKTLSAPQSSRPPVKIKITNHVASLLISRQSDPTTTNLIPTADLDKTCTISGVAVPEHNNNNNLNPCNTQLLNPERNYHDTPLNSNESCLSSNDSTETYTLPPIDGCVNDWLDELDSIAPMGHSWDDAEFSIVDSSPHHLLPQL
jgi:hypothetical protein